MANYPDTWPVRASRKLLLKLTVELELGIRRLFLATNLLEIFPAGQCDVVWRRQIRRKQVDASERNGSETKRLIAVGLKERRVRCVCRKGGWLREGWINRRLRPHRRATKTGAAKTEQ